MLVSVEWGVVRVDGHGEFKDAKIFPGGVREWDWSETGTRHRPGVQPEDVEELLDHGATTIILSTGMDEALQVPDATIEHLDEQGVDVHVLETRAAVALYNELSPHRPVGALIHSTC
ncbi:hypothetical protein J2S43_003377 [Catenuloplanes nepalensis]|uniref:Mth938-like domain-containing protein n=1 Tax=Catenuloplanes nepalensis TaxID=587533 RepID=A0ABT9MTY2_9ACTN|nr:Mth938-like domain-containing protein [Catenuloplanes nepalensis]MDP9794865.1 hypothetical protein [Catenuloplanes nepalensis]